MTEFLTQYQILDFIYKKALPIFFQFHIFKQGKYKINKNRGPAGPILVNNNADPTLSERAVLIFWSKMTPCSEKNANSIYDFFFLFFKLRLILFTISRFF